MRPFSSLALFAGLSVALTTQSFQTGREPALQPGQVSFAITADSMAPTLISGDRIISDTLYYRNHVPRGGDLIILKVPSDQPLPENVVSVQPMLVKRVVAVGGDVVSLNGKRLRVNGKDVPEPYADYKPGVVESTDFGPIKIPANRFFVLGDNRYHSFDSRQFGPIALDAIIGRPLYIHESPDKSRVGRDIR
jgi:signal peptidase I